MKTHSDTFRRGARCGHLEDGPWVDAGVGGYHQQHDRKARLLDTDDQGRLVDWGCPGYLITLPEVAEATRAHLWWTKGQLSLRVDGEQPTLALMGAIEVFDGAINGLEMALLEDAKEDR